MDTNAYIYARFGDQQIINHILQANHIYISTISLGKLRFGYLKGSKTSENNEALNSFISQPQVRVLSVGSATSTSYAAIKLDLQKRGRPIPANDLWIAAIAFEHNLPILTQDKHFAYVDSISILN